MPGVPYATAETLPALARAWMAGLPGADRPLPDPATSALLVIDVQRYFADPASHAHLPALAAVLPNVLALVRAFRAAGRPVVLTRHGHPPGTDAGAMGRWWRDVLRRGEERWRLAPELEAPAREPGVEVLDKDRYSAFRGTGLARDLRRRGVRAVVACGVATHLCVESTVRDAFMEDLDAVVVADATASFDADLHAGALRALAHGFARIALTGEVLRALGAAAGPAPRPSEEAALHGVAVLGAGPAGLAAATQLARAGLRVVVAAPRGLDGGLVRVGRLVENHPGFPGGVRGAELARRMVAQAEAAGVAVRRASALRVRRRDDGGFSVDLDDGGVLAARAVVVATGTRPRRLPELPGAAESAAELGRLRGYRVLVVGGGEAALDQAALAAERGARVALAARGGLRAMKRLVRQARELGVELRTHTRLVAVEEAGPPTLVRLAGPLGEEIAEFDHVVACIGRDPAPPELPAGADLGGPDPWGRTGVPGLYAAGDVRRGRSRQSAIAAGDGLAAAMHLLDRLERAP